MSESKAPSWLMPLVIGVIAVAVAVLIIVPAVVIVMDARPGESGPEQTPFVSEDDTVTVAIRDFIYFPQDLTVAPGTTVTWVNEDSAPHDATGRDDAFRTELLDRDDSDSVTFESPGVFKYYCSVHPWMEGTVTVQTDG